MSADITRPAEPKATGQLAPPSLSPTQESLRLFRRDKRAMASLYLLLFLVLVALFGPPIYQHIGAPYRSPLNGVVLATRYHNPYHQELENQDEFISAQYWLGTDDLGRDLLARLMQGMQISLAVAVMVELIVLAGGVTVGVLAGYYGGWIDQILARFIDFTFAFPSFLFVVLLASIFGPWADTHLRNIPLIGSNGDERLMIVSLALAVTGWPLMARYVRGRTLQMKEQPFVEAARVCGTPNLRIIRRHIVPNLLNLIVLTATLDLGGIIVGEAGISLLGLGVQPPGSSLGLMIVEGLNVIDTHPWEVLLPSLVLTSIVLALSYVGDGLQKAFDPRLKYA
ncbi:MAG TPA: ABC transporter permease [Ktedonobacteraceae bacterium]